MEDQPQAAASAAAIAAALNPPGRLRTMGPESRMGSGVHTTYIVNPRKLGHGFRMISAILYLKGRRRMMFQLSGFYYNFIAEPLYHLAKAQKLQNPTRIVIGALI